MTDEQADPGGYVLALVTDLFFTTRLRAVANEAGASLDFTDTSGDLLKRARRERPHLVIVDLEADDLDPIGTVLAMRADDALDDVRVVGFFSHVHTDLKREAEAGGYDEVLPRSAFVQRLPELLGGRVDVPR